MEAIYTFPLFILSILLPSHGKAIVNCTLLQQHARPSIFHMLHAIIRIGDIELRVLLDANPNSKGEEGYLLDALLSTNYTVVFKEPINNFKT